MSDPIIARALLATVDEELRRRLADDARAADVADAAFGEALTRVILFAQHADLVARLAPDLSPRDRFYNRYYWAQRFATQYQAQRGYDAGVAQDVFKLLETAAELDPDWTLIEALERRARED